MKARSFAIAVLIGLLGSAWTVHAGDFCFAVGVATLVTKSFKPPKPDKCRVFKGAYFSNIPAAVTGSACTNTAGTILRVGWSLEGGNGSLVGQLNIPYPSLTGGTFRYELSNAASGVQTFTGASSGAPCTTSIPIL